ncbi:putative inactive purple acid phosphatase 29 [Fusarium oxysporum f. sp. albedinis]|nr:putative inactive purple acid phosphatase 29 [Fusarium oxysporum f. sp. albedinis]
MDGSTPAFPFQQSIKSSYTLLLLSPDSRDVSTHICCLNRPHSRWTRRLGLIRVPTSVPEAPLLSRGHRAYDHPICLPIWLDATETKGMQ